MPGHPSNAFFSILYPLASHRLHKLICGTRNTKAISTKKMQVQATPSLTASIPDVNGRLILVRLHTLYKQI
ncbi:hypothetical protein ACS0TY_033105 [Phlomoides rotata]